MPRSLGLTLLTVLLAAVLARAETDARLDALPTELVLATDGRTAACDVLAFTPDGKSLLAAGDDKVVRSWAFDGSRLTPDGVLRWSIFREQRGNIYAMALSPDGKNVAVGGFGVRSGAAAILDRASHKTLFGVTPQSTQDRKQGSIWAIAFAPSGQRVVYGSEDGGVWLWEPKANSVKRLGGHSDGVAVRRASFTPGDRVRHVSFLDENRVLTLAEDGWLLEWDLAKIPSAPTRRFQFDKVTNIVAAALDAPRGRLAAIGQGGSARFIEVRGLDGANVALLELPAGRTYPRCLAFDSTGARLAVGTYAIPASARFYKIKGGEVYLFDVNMPAKAPTLGPKPSYYLEALAFHPTRDLLAIAGGDDHDVAVYDLAKPAEPVASVAGPGQCLWGVGLSRAKFADPDRDGKTRELYQLGVRTSRTEDPPHPNRRATGAWKVFDLTERRWATANEAKAFAPVEPLDSLNGWTVEPDSGNGYLWRVLDPGGRAHILSLDAPDDMPRCYTFLKATETKPARLAVGHYWGVSVYALESAGPRLVRKCVGHQGEVSAIAPSPDGRMLVTASRDQTVAGWSLEDWPGHPELGARFSIDGETLKVDAVEPGSPAAEAKLEVGDTIGKFAFHAKLVTGGPAKWLETLRDLRPGRECYFDEVRRNGKIIGSHLTTARQRPLWRFFPMRDREWVLWRQQDFYYDTSTSGDFRIGWQLSREVDKTPEYYSAEQFRARFHKPEKVAEALASPTPVVTAVSLPHLEPPRVTLEVLPESKVRVTAARRGPREGQDLARIVLWVNDHQFAEIPASGDTFARDIDVPANVLRAGANRLTVQGYNRLDIRDQAFATLTVDRPVPKPSLFGLAIAVGDYRLAGLPNLQAPSDAEALKEAWEKQSGKTFANVSFRVVADEKVTRANVLAELKRLGEVAGPDDCAVLFVGGHGTTGEELADILKADGRALQEDVPPGTFVFCTADFDATRPKATGLTGDDLYAAVRGLKCRKLVLLDTCHAGSKVNPVRRLVPQGLGPIILSACEPHETAKESPLLSLQMLDGRPQGLFTIALLLAFDQDFATAAQGSPILTAEDLSRYLRRQVPDLLRVHFPALGQHPTIFLPPTESQVPVVGKPR